MSLASLFRMRKGDGEYPVLSMDKKGALLELPKCCFFFNDIRGQQQTLFENIPIGSAPAHQADKPSSIPSSGLYLAGWKPISRRFFFFLSLSMCMYDRRRSNFYRRLGVILEV